METLHIYPSKSQEEAVIAFLDSMGILYSKDEQLPEHVIEGIQQGLDDVSNGNTITLEEFIRLRSSRL